MANGYNLIVECVNDREQLGYFFRKCLNTFRSGFFFRVVFVVIHCQEYGIVVCFRICVIASYRLFFRVFFYAFVFLRREEFYTGNDIANGGYPMISNYCRRNLPNRESILPESHLLYLPEFAVAYRY